MPGDTPATIERRIAAELARLEERLAAALVVEGGGIARDAAERAPTLSGELAGSVFVAGPEQNVVTVGFTSEHAVVVHEDTGARHDDGEAKFLEHAVNAAAVGMEQRLAAAVRR